MKKLAHVVPILLLMLLANPFFFAILTQAGSKEPIILVGKNPGKIKGRWLEINNVDKLQQYDAVFIGEVVVNIDWKKKDRETPVDEELLKGKIKERIIENLRNSKIFPEVLKRAPGNDRSKVLEIACDLWVQPGNRGIRYFVGYGVGKSKAIFNIQLKDFSTGEDIGFYHGYGSGSGMGFKLVGGGAEKMTRDDIQENSEKFVKLLKKVIKNSGG